MAGRIRSPLRAVRNLFLTGLDPASLAGMAAAVAVAGEYPPPGAGGGPPEFLTGPPGQGPPAPTGGSPGEFLAPSGKREMLPTISTENRTNRDLPSCEPARERTLCLRPCRFIGVILATRRWRLLIRRRKLTSSRGHNLYISFQITSVFSCGSLRYICQYMYRWSD